MISVASVRIDALEIEENRHRQGRLHRGASPPARTPPRCARAGRAPAPRSAGARSGSRGTWQAGFEEHPEHGTPSQTRGIVAAVKTNKNITMKQENIYLHMNSRWLVLQIINVMYFVCFFPCNQLHIRHGDDGPPRGSNALPGPKDVR